jgi:50S ribosomal protein L16 3-hydroxylase
MTHTKTAFNGLVPAQFMRNSWHRQAQLFRDALPGFEGFLDRRSILELACDPDVESRLLVRDGRRWQVDHGPFKRAAFRRLPDRNWTVLVQGVNLHLDAADRLLRRFDFVPAARLDDLMVSYAAPGGGVGPHFDSYDVFLLQGPGRRRWRIGRQDDLTLRPGLPLKILKDFAPEEEMVVEPGDLLYLPPTYAHDGVAIDECFTYSIGFRAPTNAELAGQFLADVSERVALDGRYADPGLRATKTPGRIPAAMVDATNAAIDAVRWTRGDVADFLGRYLSDPKARVFFDPPEDPPTFAAFRKALANRVLALDRRTILLYGPKAAYINGECIRFPRGVPAALETLADRREWRGGEISDPVLRLLHQWLEAGFLTMTDTDRSARG